MCYMCEQDGGFDHACCEECGEAVCFDVVPDDAIDAGETAKTVMAMSEPTSLLRKATRWKHGIFCAACHDMIVAEEGPG